MAVRIALFFGLVMGLAGVTAGMGTLVADEAVSACGSYKTC